jgi:hypothetical protein
MKSSAGVERWRGPPALEIGRLQAWPKAWPESGQPKMGSRQRQHDCPSVAWSQHVDDVPVGS